MALLQTYGKFYTGSVWQYTYSPKGLDVLDRFDRHPLVLWVNFDNMYRLMSGINLHWLTVEQRRQLMNLLAHNYPDISKKAEYQKPINFTWDNVKSWFPIGRIAWRKYFPARIRNVQLMSPTWSADEIESIINTDTAKIIGVTPAMIQKHFAESQARKMRAAAQRHREAIQRRTAVRRKKHK